MLLFLIKYYHIIKQLKNHIKNGKIVALGDTNTVKGDSSLEEVFLELANHE